PTHPHRRPLRHRSLHSGRGTESHVEHRARRQPVPHRHRVCDRARPGHHHHHVAVSLSPPAPHPGGEPHHRDPLVLPGSGAFLPSGPHRLRVTHGQVR